MIPQGWMIVGLIGRTNVGKSTLFNRLLGTFRAIVTDIPGTTRELLRETTVIDGQEVTLVDSPGLDSFAQELPFLQEIIATSDVLLFVVDGKAPLSQHDSEIQKMIFQARKKSHTILVVNKLDSHVYSKKTISLLSEFYALGFDTVIPLSATQGEGIGELREQVREVAKTIKLQKKPIRSTDEKLPIPLAIIGRPNVGKSTLLNTLTGEYLAHVQDQPGTTLDYIRASFVFGDKTFDLYDTAGIRKKGKTAGIERIAYEKTIAMVKHVHPVVVLLIDLDEGMTQRDKTLLGELIDLGVPIVVAVNKIDLVAPHEADYQVKRMAALLSIDRVPFVKISAQDGVGLPKLLEQAYTTWKASRQRISTPSLNKTISSAWIKSPPRFPKNKACKIKYLAQIEAAPPVFALSVNNEEYANFSFKKRCENVIRSTYEFPGVPIYLKFSSKSEKNPYVKGKKD